MAKPKLSIRLSRLLRSLAEMVEELSNLPPDDFQQLVLEVDEDAELLRRTVVRVLSTDELIVGAKHDD